MCLSAIDWEAVRGSGVTFAFIKATEGGDRADPQFLSSRRAARAEQAGDEKDALLVRLLRHGRLLCAFVEAMKSP